VSFDGDDTSPLAFSAAVIAPVSDNSPDVLNGDTQVAVGPVTAPIYLSNNGLAVGETTDPDPEVGEDILVNGDFDVTEAVPTFANVEVDGWQSNNGSLEIWADGFLGADAVEGSHLTELDIDGGLDAIFQDVQTEAGTEYTLSFHAAQRGNDNDSIEVYWAGELIDVVTPNSGADFVPFSFTVTGTGGADRLSCANLRRRTMAQVR